VSDFEGGKQYWLTYSDGSRIRVTAEEDSHGEIDLKNDDLDFFLWSGGDTNLDGFTWEEVK
jgi:hypothetical protein